MTNAELEYVKHLIEDSMEGHAGRKDSHGFREHSHWTHDYQIVELAKRVEALEAKSQ